MSEQLNEAALTDLRKHLRLSIFNLAKNCLDIRSKYQTLNWYLSVCGCK